jgi:FkbM family methyltransferase
MASVKSKFRNFIKPLFFKILPNRFYLYFQYLAKLKDINQKLVEEPELIIFPQFLTKESNVIDVGANYAYITHRFSVLCPKGKVFSFEPIPFTFKVAKKIIKKLHLKNVELYQLGVGEKNEKIKFEVPLQDFGAYSAGQAHITGRDNEIISKAGQYDFKSYETVECELVKLDDFNKINVPIDFIKIDIEGAELFALKGMKNLILKNSPIIFMEINPHFLKAFNIEESELNLFFSEINYKIFTFDASLRKIKNFEGPFLEDNYFLIPESKIENFNHLIV